MINDAFIFASDRQQTRPGEDGQVQQLARRCGALCFERGALYYRLRPAVCFERTLFISFSVAPEKCATLFEKIFNQLFLAGGIQCGLFIIFLFFAVCVAF